ncbi:MAG: TIGR03960 family B12-binding radical SAM protein [Dehalococcoidia bacterium]|nr:TIGR03960 family B12-binding radical SAM protein [Dehalococcoidia bacterium]
MSYPDSMLSQVTRPGRYTGGEWNSVRKGWSAAEVKVALVYPDVYEIGMSNMALPILYDILNSQEGVLAERAFAPWFDMEAAMRQAQIPLLSLESKRPLAEFDIIGFSLGYELTYTNVLNMLDLSGIPVLSSDRSDSHPIIIGGGSCALNPEPMADFMDAFAIGDGEELTVEIVQSLRQCRRDGARRTEILLRLADIPGVYVPGLSETQCHPGNDAGGPHPRTPQVRPSIRRRIMAELPPPVTRPVVPFVSVIHDRGAVEIQRGCTRGCRFCQAGFVYRPQRHRSHEEVLEAVRQLIKNCGYNEISLVSLTTTDYPGIDSLVSRLVEEHGEDRLALSLPSLRIDGFSLKLMESLRFSKKPGLTFAPEAGTERLRKVINKSVPDDAIVETIAAALAKGWTNIKLYFMIGLPTETLDDVEGIVHIVERLRRESKKSPPRIRISVSTFVPKPHTPFQWVAQDSQTALKAKHEVLKNGLRHARAHLSWEDPETSLLETILARGDRHLGRVIHHAWQAGATFDAWSERFKYECWLRAFDKTGIDPAFYAYRERPLDEVLPWSHIDIGVNPAFLRQEYQRTYQGVETADCRVQCSACGLEAEQSVCRASGTKGDLSRG